MLLFYVELFGVFSCGIWHSDSKIYMKIQWSKNSQEQHRVGRFALPDIITYKIVSRWCVTSTGINKQTNKTEENIQRQNYTNMNTWCRGTADQWKMNFSKLMLRQSSIHLGWERMKLNLTLSTRSLPGKHQICERLTFKRS